MHHRYTLSPDLRHILCMLALVWVVLPGIGAALFDGISTSEGTWLKWASGEQSAFGCPDDDEEDCGCENEDDPGDSTEDDSSDLPAPPPGPAGGPTGGNDDENPTAQADEANKPPDPEVDPTGGFGDDGNSDANDPAGGGSGEEPEPSPPPGTSTDMKVKSNGQSFSASRRYNSNSNYNGGFGHKTDSSFFARVDNNSLRALVYVNGDAPIKFAKAGSVYVDTLGRTLMVQNGQYRFARPNGITYYFDSTSGRAISKTHLNGATFEWSYDGTGRLTALRDGTGSNIYTLEYNGTLITKVHDAVGNRDVVYEYDLSSGVLTRAKGNCSSCGPVAQLRYEYDSNHNMVTVRNSGGEVVLSNLFDGLGRVTKQTRKSGVHMISDYSNYANLQYKVVGYANVTRHYHLNNRYGVTKLAISGSLSGTPRTHVYTWDRDEQNQVTRRVTPTGKIMRYTLDSMKRKTHRILYDATTPLTIAKLEYGAYSRITRRTDAGGHVTTYAYDAQGNKLTRSHITAAGNLLATWDYDNRGNVLTRKIGSSRVTAYQYNHRGFMTRRTVDPGAGGLDLTESYQVDALGRVTRRTDPRGQVWKAFYNQAGRVTKRVAPTGRTLLLTFDNDQHLISKTDQSAEVSPLVKRTTTYHYDRFGNLTRKSLPASGATVRHLDLAYDNRNRVTYRKTPTGEEFATSYGNLGLPFKRQVKKPSVGFVDRARFDYDGERNLTRLINAKATPLIKDRMFDQYNRMTKRVDALNHERTFRYTPQGKVAALVAFGSPAQAEILRDYDDAGRLTRIRALADPGGNPSTTQDVVTEWLYDDMDRLTKQQVVLSGTDGSATTMDADFVYDDAGRLITLLRTDGPTIAYSYDSAGNLLTRKSDPAGLALTTTYLYDDLNRVTRRTYPDGTSDAWFFDGLGRVTKTAGHTSSGIRYLAKEYLFDDGLNVVTRSYRYADPATQSGFNSLTDPNVSYLYNDGGRLTAVVDTLGNTTSYVYDYLGREVTRTDAAGNQLVHMYDGDDRVITRIRRDYDGTNYHDFTTAYLYDNLDRITKTVDQGSDGDIAQTADNREVGVWYDALGRITQTQDAEDRLYARHFDQLGRLTRFVEDAPGGVGVVARTTDYAYDRYGRLTRQTGYTDGTTSGSAQHTDYAYSRWGVRTRLTYPDDAVGDRGYVEFFFDAALRLTKRVDQEGLDTTYAYDGMGRRLTVTRGGEVDSFGYTDWGALASAQRGTSANLDAVSKVDRFYDDLNRVTRESQSIRESVARSVDYVYDRAGNLLTLGYPSGVDIETSFDALHRRDVVTRDGASIADYDYVGPGGRIADLTIETGTHDLTLTPAYDGLFRATRLPWARNGVEQAAFGYTYDEVSNILTKAFEHLAGDPVESYLYDRLDRLTRVDYGWKPSGGYEAFTLDDLGNRTTHDQNGTPLSAFYNSVNELTKLGTTQVAYSKTGNLTKDADGYEFVYDRSDQLTHIKDSSGNAVASYAYDALGRRIELVDQKASTTTRFYYTARRVIEDTDASDVVQRHYVWGNYIDELLLMRDVAGVGGTANADYVIARDHQYSPVALVKRSDGSVVERYAYNAHGKTEFQNASGTALGTQASAYGLRYTFTGRELDILDNGNLRVMYFRNRYYDPATARWYQRDPLGYVDGMSLYGAYFLPNRLDPWGLACCGGVEIENAFQQGLGCKDGQWVPREESEEGWTDFNDQFGNNFKQGSNDVKEAVEDGTDAVGDAIEEAGEATGNPYVGGAAAGLGEAVRETGDVANKLGDAAQDIAEGGVNAVTDPIGTAKDTAQAIKDAPENAVNKAMDIYNGVGDGSYGLEEAGDDFQDLGTGAAAAAAGTAVGSKLPGSRSPGRGPGDGGLDGGCFVAGTFVLTETGPKAIEQVSQGERVWAYDPQTEGWALTAVVEPLVHEYDGDLVTVAGEDFIVEATGNHPLWVESGDRLMFRPALRHPGLDYVSSTGGRWVEARHLRVGDMVLFRSGERVKITQLSTRDVKTLVYNLHVEGPHTYAVTEAGVVVHNTSQRPGRVGDLPARGKPSSSEAKDYGGGKGQIRDYDEKGRAKTDYDFGHDHGAGDPHAHDWDWSKPKPRQPGRPLKPDE